MKLSSATLKKIITEEIQNLKELTDDASADGGAMGKPLARDVENVLGQFKNSAQTYIDKVDTVPELVDMLKAFIGMLKQKGLSDSQIGTALTSVKALASKGEL